MLPKAVTKPEKLIGVLGLIGLLSVALLAGGSLLFDLALPLLGRVWRNMTPDGKLALVEGCILYGLAGPFLVYAWTGAKRLRDALAIAVIAVVIMPCFVLGYSEVSELWRSLFRAAIAW